MFRKQPGFSLFELLAVLGIMGIMSAIVIPNLISWRHNAMIRGAAFNIKSDMEMAKARAIRSGSINVVISFTSDSYEIFLDPDNSYTNTSGDTLIAEKWIDGVSIESAFPDTSKKATAFNNRGQATRAGTVTVYNGNKNIVISLSSIGLISM